MTDLPSLGEMRVALEALHSACDVLMGDTDPADPDDPQLLAMQRAALLLQRFETAKDRCARCGISRDLGSVSCRDADGHVWETPRRVGEDSTKYPPCDHLDRGEAYCEKCSWANYQAMLRKAKGSG